jgi:hypothetical protein
MTETDTVAAIGINLETAKAMGAVMPMGQLGTPDDIARVALLSRVRSVVLGDGAAHFWSGGQR